MDALQDIQAGLAVIGIKCNRTLVISVSARLTAGGDQLVAARNPTLILTEKPFSPAMGPKKS
jgi:hypothetical protein